MAEDERNDVPEQRSTSGTITQGVAASGALAYGLGQLAEGVAKVKDSFGGGGQQPVAPAAPQPEQPKQD